MKYYLWILGCAMNYSDAERISSILNNLGYSKTDNEKEADIFIVVACSVRQSAINRIYGKIKDLNDIKKRKKLVTILSGCVLEEDRKKMQKVFDIIFEIKELEKLPSLLANFFPISTNKKTSNDYHDDKLLSGEYLAVTPQYESTFRAYVPIMTGCNNFCSYCAVPYTRGRESSRKIDEIVNEIKTLIKNGYKEITLLGQNVNSYGNDLQDASKNNFAKLLTKIDQLEGDFRVYFYSNHPKDMSDELIQTLPSLKHFPHYIHLPLQSGNNEIIKKMNRHYTKKDYLQLVEKIRKALPNVTITTDIIVGFPGEDEEKFKDTIEVMKKVEYDMAFIARYSKRSKTVAAKFAETVSDEEKEKRENILQEILSKTAFENNKKLVGTTQKILIDEKKGAKVYGRTQSYKVVEIKTQNKDITLGNFINVKITEATSWKLFGEIED